MTETAVCKWCAKIIDNGPGGLWYSSSTGSKCHSNPDDQGHEPSPVVPLASDEDVYDAISEQWAKDHPIENIGVVVPAAQTVPIPEDLRWLYEASPVLGNVNFNVETGRSLIERIARAEDSKAYFAELHTKQYENMKAELARAEATIAELQEAAQFVIDWFEEIRPSLKGPRVAYLQAAIARATGKES